MRALYHGIEINSPNLIGFSRGMPHSAPIKTKRASERLAAYEALFFFSILARTSASDRCAKYCAPIAL